MKKLIFLSLLLGVLLVLFGCGAGGDDEYPTLTYMVDGTVFYEDVLESEAERFGNIGEKPEKAGFYFGGWYYDEGTWKQPLSYTDLNNATEKNDVCVYAKWEVVDLRYEEDSRTYTVVGLLSGAGETVVIPAKYGELPVTAIAPNAFRANTKLKAVTIPDSVKEIGDYAFAECTALERIVVPNTVTTLGKNAFSNCVAVTEVKLSTALTEIPAELFAGCQNLASVNIPATATKIGARAFLNCNQLSDLTVARSVKTIGMNAFQGTAIKTLKYAGSAASWAKVSRANYAEGSSITEISCSDTSVAP